ncbi:MAG: FecR domain-containing protein [Natronospirillum sp.]
MKASINYTLSLGAWLLSACLLLAPLAVAQNIGTVVMVRGDVTAENAAGETRALSRRSEVLVGDLLATGPDARLQIRMIDNALIDLRPETALRMEVYQGESPNAEDRVLMDLVNGTLSTLTGTFGRSTDDAYEVRAASATIGIRGTAYGLFNDPNSNSVFTTVTNGVINLSSPNGNILLGPTQPFRNGRIIGNQPPQGLLLPPQELLDALLSGNDDGNGEEEEGDGEGGQDVAGSPPIEGDVDDPQRDNESVTGETLLSNNLQQTRPDVENNQLTIFDRRVTSRDQRDISTSDQVFFGSSASEGNFNGIMVSRFMLGDADALTNSLVAMYDETPNFSNGYVIANEILRINDHEDADSENWGWFVDNEQANHAPESSHIVNEEDYDAELHGTPDVVWGYWDSLDDTPNAHKYGNENSANPTSSIDDRLWYVFGTPDASLELANLSFNSVFVMGSDSGGIVYDGSFSMDIDTLGVVGSTSLYLLGSTESHEWDLNTEGGQSIINGTLHIDNLAGGYNEAAATGNLDGFFNKDNVGEGEVWFFGTFDAQSGDTNVNGVIAAQDQEPH